MSFINPKQHVYYAIPDTISSTKNAWPAVQLTILLIKILKPVKLSFSHCDFILIVPIIDSEMQTMPEEET